MTLNLLLASFALLSLGLFLWQVTVAARFPLHRRLGKGEFHPGVSVLKPLKGCDCETFECLQSWVRQEYPGPCQFLFGVASSDDPVRSLVERLVNENPDRNIQLVTCDHRLGPNAKVSQLVQLERMAEHDLICVSDADVWAPADFLSEAVSMLGQPGVGLVNSFYGFGKATGFGMRWEAFAVNADFWSQVLQARSLKPIDFALGAAMVLRRDQLNATGGFSVLLESLADDYQLGKQISGAGSSIELCPVVVECRSAPMSFAEAWVHQLRWARTIRACQPWPFFFSILSNPSLWPLLWMVAAPSPISASVAGVCLALRASAGMYLESRLTRKRTLASCWLAWTRDILQLAMWLFAFSGSQVIWRAERYRVEPGGRLVKLNETGRSSPRTKPAKA